VRWTRDNVPVIMHDDDLARTTNGTGLVSESTIDYIKTLDLDNGGGKIPMFDEVLTWAQQNNLQIWPEYKPEMPNQLWIDDYAARIRASGANTVVPSFLKPELAQFKTLLPGYTQIWFHDPLSYKPALVADVPAGAWAGIINVFSNATVYDAMAKAGIPVYTWFNIITGGDNATGWDAMAKLKPVGIITDYPAEYQKWGATTTFCLKVQKAKCAKLPKKLPGGATTVILTRTCTTNAGKKVTVKVSGRATRQKGKNGRISVVTGSSGMAQVSLQAKAKKGYKAFSKAKKYKLT
jgi:glycerophosphoryl diester phosphodiesterase